jgi:hypothetical protein
MNYHTAIEQLRHEMLANRDIHTPQQREEGYLRLMETIEQYLASESRP